MYNNNNNNNNNNKNTAFTSKSTNSNKSPGTNNTTSNNTSNNNGGMKFEIQQGSEVYIIENMEPQHTVLYLKRMIEQRIGVPVFGQKLIFKGSILKDTNTLEKSKLIDGSKMILLSYIGNNKK